jgi:S-adenosylmethionine:diacylglycerol 3-amino-3-carboxypropyl transferase
VVAKFFNLLRRDKIKTLFSFSDIEEQRDYLVKEWDTWFLRKIFEVVLNPKIVKFIINDPGLNSFVDSSINPGVYIYQRKLKYLKDNLAKKSPLLQLLLTGKLLPDAYFPYLTFAGYSKIRQNMGRLNYRTDNIVKFLSHHPPNAIDCFSMSDIASYMPQPAFEKLLQGMYQAAKPNARFCMREFMSKRRFSANLNDKFQRNVELEQKLENEESNFVYRFFVGEIKD